MNYVAAMREIAGCGSLRNTIATDAQFTIDVGGKLRLGQHFELYVNLRNLLDARDIVSRRPYGARPNAPRWFQAGLRAEL